MSKEHDSKKEPNKLVQDWIDRQALVAIQMSEDDNYRQLVTVRATNWGKHIQAKSDARIRRANAPHLEIK